MTILEVNTFAEDCFFAALDIVRYTVGNGNENGKRVCVERTYKHLVYVD